MMDNVQPLSTHTAPYSLFSPFVLYLARVASALHSHHVWEA